MNEEELPEPRGWVLTVESETEADVLGWIRKHCEISHACAKPNPTRLREYIIDTRRPRIDRFFDFETPRGIDGEMHQAAKRTSFTNATNGPR
jgi:hypothetical protein